MGFCRVSKVVAYVNQKKRKIQPCWTSKWARKGISTWFAKTHVKDFMGLMYWSKKKSKHKA